MALKSNRFLKHQAKGLFAFLIILITVSFAHPIFAFETRAKAAWVYDVGTQTILLEKNASQSLPPASMSKLMTLNMLFEALRDRRISLDTRFSVSTKAKNMGGSTMFLDETDRPTVEELIRGIIVLSGNDACVAVAEGLAGTEENFARQMTERAKALGMNNSTFGNASGWPHPNQRMSMEDLGLLALRLINEFPEYYGYFQEREFPFDNRAPQNRFNRNPLLKLGIGADGLKTGHTSEAGYGLVGSAKQGDRRIVFVITGLTSEKERAEEAERVTNWAFRQFSQKSGAKIGQEFGTAPIWMGESSDVTLVSPIHANFLVSGEQNGPVEANIIMKAPFEAPIAKGDQLAELVITATGLPTKKIPLVAGSDVARGGISARMKSAYTVLFEKITNQPTPE